MKVIFLDIDGILNVMATNRDQYGDIFRTEFVSNLARIVRETGAKIVISSAWRMSGLEVMREMWLKRGLAGEVIDVTPVIPPIEEGKCVFKKVRGMEIMKWVLDEVTPAMKPFSYVILDDDTDMLDSQLPYFLQCSELKDEDAVHGYGLTKRITERAIEILNS